MIVPFQNVTKLINSIKNTFSFQLQGFQDIKTINKTIKVMGALIANGVCCFFGVCCRPCSEGLQKIIGPQRVTKLFYLFLVLVFVTPTIFAFFFLYNWQDFKDFFDEWWTCPETDNYECIGASLIYRLSLTLVGFFLLMSLLMVFRNRLSQVLNQGFFWLKYLIVLGAFFGLFFVDNSHFEDYAQATKYISIAYMIIQTIILIDLCYLAGIKLIKRYDQGKRRYAFYLIVLTVLFEAMAIFMNIFGYTQFSSTQNGTCSSTTWVNVITSVIIILLPIIQLIGFNPQSSLLTTSLITFYISYLSLMCQYSYDGDCVRLTTPSFAVDVGISTLFFALQMYGSIMGGSKQIRSPRGGDLNRTLGVAPTTSKVPISQNGQRPKPHTQLQLRNQEVREKEVQKQYEYSWDWVKWHFYMALAAIYIAALVTNWNSADVVTNQLKSSGFSFWVRLSIAWLSTLLYIWTLVAPKLFPIRDFNVE